MSPRSKTLLVFSKMFVSFIAALVMHALLFLHITVCSHKSMAEEVITLNISIEPQFSAFSKSAKKEGSQNDDAQYNSQEEISRKEVANAKLGALEELRKNAKNEIIAKKSNPQNGKESEKFSLSSDILPVLLSPKFLHYEPPVYPKAAKRLKQEGIVVVDVKLEKGGVQSPACVHTSSGYNLLDSAAVEAANRSHLNASFNELHQGETACIARIKYQFRLH